MKPVNSALTAAVFSLGKGSSRSAHDLLPSDALVIVIEERAIARAAPLEIHCSQLWDPTRPEYEALPALRQKAKSAYGDYPLRRWSSGTIDLAA
jgi:P2-related tail formation protein